MALVNMADLIGHAHQSGYAIGAFCVGAPESLQAAIEGAEACGAPVILSVTDDGSTSLELDLLLPMVETAARRCRAPVAIQYGGARDVPAAVRSIRFGCNGIRLAEPVDLAESNRVVARRAVEVSHGCGVPVEGVLLADTDDGHLSGLKEYLEDVALDVLSISVTAASARGENRFRDLGELRQVLRIPIALDGAADLEDAEYVYLAGLGVAKVNFSSGVYTSADIARRLELLGAAGRAEQALEQCRPWTEVAHLIIYNSTATDVAATREMIAQGKQVLAKIPGVREVFVGEAVRDGAAYRYTWLVRFCSEAVIDSYRTHPDHVAFADGWFRPLAGDRISIDYAELTRSVQLPETEVDHWESA